jgi:hypothetical protein
MFVASFVQLLPILILTLSGYIITRIYYINLDTIIKLLADFFMPLLIFHSLYYSDLKSDLIFSITGAVIVVIGLNGIISYLYARIAKIDARGFMPANIFSNSGFLGIPLMKLWGGLAAVNVIVVYEQINSTLIYTLGILIITGGLSAQSLRSIIRSPILWTIFLSIIIKVFSITIPDPILATCEFGGNATSPLAALVLGASLSTTKIRFNRHIFVGICIRMVGGFLFGYVGATLFGLTGLSRTVVVVTSALPAAVFSSVLPMRYGVTSEYASSIVIISTILSIVTIPLTFMFFS